MNVAKVEDAILNRDVNIWIDTRASERQVQSARGTHQVESFLKLIKPTKHFITWNIKVHLPLTGSTNLSALHTLKTTDNNYVKQRCNLQA